MKLNDLIKRTDELIQLGNQALATRKKSAGVGEYVDPGKFAEFRSASLSFLKRTFSDDSPHFTEFDSKVADSDPWRVEQGLGVLRSCRDEISGGWAFTTKGLVSAEVFSDFLSMAEHLLRENYKDPAAVVAGSVLEEHLRQLCQKNSIPIESAKPDGSFIPLKADALNSELARANVYSKLDQKNITAWLDLRNKAAHGRYSEYTEAQVDNLLRAISEFIGRTPL